jgi:DNA-directed RNA polymerase specialized sigma24 family protein
MTGNEREQLIMQLVDRFTPHIHKFASGWNVDFDEMYQDACIRIIRLVDDPRIKLEDLSRYANVSVHHYLMDRVKYLRRRQMVSLDEPLSIDNKGTLADVIPSPYSCDPAYVAISKETLEALATTVVCLRGSHGAAVRERYEAALQEVQAW